MSYRPLLRAVAFAVLGLLLILAISKPGFAPNTTVPSGTNIVHREMPMAALEIISRPTRIPARAAAHDVTIQSQKPSVSKSTLSPHTGKGPTSGKRIAVMITITKDMPLLDGAAVLAESVRAMHSSYPVDLIAMVHPGVTKSRTPLSGLGYEVIERPIPLDLDHVPEVYIREGKAGCCGHYEFLKLEALALYQYWKVLALDVDSLILGNIDELFASSAVLQYTVDWEMDADKYNTVPPVQGGFLLFTPNKTAYEDLVAIARKADWREDGTAWGGKKIGYHWGGTTIQGILPYYFGSVAPPNWWKRLDICIYNHMGTKNCSEHNEDEITEHIKSTHFTACQKPWECFWDLRSKFPDNICTYFQAKWWAFRDRLQRRLGKYSPPLLSQRCKNKKYEPLREVAELRGQV